MTTHCIDWLSYTYQSSPPPTPSGNAPKGLHRFAHIAEDTPWKSEKSRFGYSAAFSPSSFPGPVVYCWPQDGRSHTHVQWSGSALAYSQSARALLSEVVKQGAKVTRLDLAVDIQAGDPLDVWFASGRDEVLTRLKKRAMITSDSGVTVYLGSRTSGKFIRVYDKAGQLGLPGPWVRVELELKGDDANGIARYLVEAGDQAIPSTILAVIDCPTLPWWREAFNDQTAVWGAPKIPASPDRAAWIAKQVVPALIDMHRTDEKQFVHTYGALLRRVGQATGYWSVEFDNDTVERYDCGETGGA